MPARRRAREVALQSLYQIEANPGTEHVERFIAGRLHGGPLVPFARGLVDGVMADRGALDALIDACSENWRLNRMAATDRAILRIAAFELVHLDTPGPVAIDEAIELARRYGTAASPRFVSGILGRLLADREAGRAPAAAVSPRPTGESDHGAVPLGSQG